MLTCELIERILETVAHRTVGLLGDLFLDRYLDIDPTRDEPSVETGLTAYQVIGTRSYPGALGTVLGNLAALGVGRIVPIAAIGDDGEGHELRQALQAMPNVDMTGIFTASNRFTPTYIKPMYGDRELNRLDIKNRTPTPDEVQDSILKLLADAWPQLDALIVLDQVSEEDCGVVTRRVRDRLGEFGAREPGKFVLADSRERVGEFRQMCMKPNRDEMSRYAESVGRNSHDDAAVLQLARHLGRTVFATSGEGGIRIGRPQAEECRSVPAYSVAGPIDICGAGDACSAGIAAAMISGATDEEAAAFGNLAASITIQQIGVTGRASPAQVRARWREVQ